MGALGRFLLALSNMVETGSIRKIGDAFNMAKQEFGEVTPLLQKQIERIFAKGKKQDTGVKKEGKVIEASFKPGKSKYRDKEIEESPSQKSGIMATDKTDEFNLSKDDPFGDLEKIVKNEGDVGLPNDQASGIMQRLEKQKDDLFNMLKDNPYRAGGPLDPKMGLVRTAARQVLQKLAREGKINIADEREAKAIIEGYQGGVDPIEVFRKTFGQDVLIDLANLGDELIEIENRGGSFKELKKILDDQGFFDLKQPKNPPQGMTDDELEKMLRDDKEEKILKDFDPEDRDPNAMGGIMRANYKIGSGVRLAKFLASKGKNLKEEIKKAVDNIFTTDDPKYDADVALDSMLEELDVDRDMFDQKDIIDAYGMAYDEIAAPFAQKILNKRSNKAKELAPKMVERLELKQKYPGADDEMLDQILEMDPNRKAQMLADMDMGVKLLREGKGVDEVKDIIEKGLKTRKDNAEGGLNYLMGM